tara:strand:+ start:988 stop:2601 length:1614 start_codon:yes stop_codon:yes gene_type:complete
MSMDKSLMEKYSPQIKIAIDFFESTKSSAIRKNNAWTGDSEHWLMHNPKCPTCDEKMTKETLTREHVHPLVLGGKEKQYNVRPMCKTCNSIRNNIMEGFVGGNKVSTLRKRWPLNKKPIIRFLIWSHATVYGDFHDIDSDDFSELNKEFSKLRGIDLLSKSGTGNIFSKVADAGRKVFQFLKPKSTSQFKKQSKKIKCGFCDAKLSIPHGYSGKFRCPSCKKITQNNTTILNSDPIPEEVEQEALDYEEKKFPLERWVKENWKGIENGKTVYVELKLAITANEKANGFSRNIREILSQDHKISKNNSVEKIIKYLHSLSVVENPLNDSQQVRTELDDKNNSNNTELEEIENRETFELDDSKEKIDRFRLVLIQLIGNHTWRYNQLIEKIKSYLVEIEIESPTPTLFLEQFGLPKGLKKQILVHASDLVEIEHLNRTTWQINLGKECTVMHNKLEQLLLESFSIEEHKIKGIGLDEFWVLVKFLKNESESSWTAFMRNFGMSEKGGMVHKCKTLIPMLEPDFQIMEIGDNKHRIFLNK